MFQSGLERILNATALDLRKKKLNQPFNIELEIFKYQ